MNADTDKEVFFWYFYSRFCRGVYSLKQFTMYIEQPKLFAGHMWHFFSSNITATWYKHIQKKSTDAVLGYQKQSQLEKEPKSMQMFEKLCNGRLRYVCKRVQKLYRNYWNRHLIAIALCCFLKTFVIKKGKLCKVWRTLNVRLYFSWINNSLKN